MSWDLRKTVIALVSLGALVIVYLVYTHSYRTPWMDIRPTEDPQGLSGGARSRNPGQMGGVKVGIVEGFIYQDRDDQGRVYREWGFTDLWHRQDNVWEAKEPFVRLSLPDANCAITADWGRFTLQSGHNQAFPTDAAFSGHVVLQIQPLPGRDVPACKINLDDITFVGTTSRFTSSGQIEFVSDTFRWTGRQAEFVYNDQLRCVEYFKLAHLDGLYLKVPKDQSVMGSGTPGLPSPATGQALPVQSYQCLLRDRVTVQTARQAVSAQQYLLLTDLVWSVSSGKPGLERSSGSEMDRPGPSIGVADDLMEVSVVCDGPVVVTPNGVAAPADANGPGPGRAQPTRKARPSGQTAKDLEQFSAQAIRYSVWTRDAVAEGPVELIFLAKDVMAKEGQGLVPVRVTASQRSVYQAQANRILLDGPCLCTLVRRQAGVTEQLSLASPRLIVDLLEDKGSVLSRSKDGQRIASPLALKYLRADGGTVELRIESGTGGQPTVGVDTVAAADSVLLSGAKMVCTQLDFDPQSPGQVITAIGPGTIWLNNSTSQKAGRLLDSNQPFYALLRQFETMQFFLADNCIVAEGKTQPMLVDYFPIIDGRQDRHIRAEADSVQIDLVRTDRHETDLGSLTAKGNVYYDDQNHQFAAYKLVYDHRTHWMEMTGPDNQPCTADGVSVWGISYNVKTQQGQTRIVGPAMGLIH